ncbi:unnamed protein product [Soboliphyme baturini]|uniref:DUF295 domain-containing protein n=1 Tax=Soboliphyme baturini TaxID=241478 RepID=A0A183IP23_9BILA|nr:unnamed protein product [Soboliphyme baturini]
MGWCDCTGFVRAVELHSGDVLESTAVGRAVFVPWRWLCRGEDSEDGRIFEVAAFCPRPHIVRPDDDLCFVYSSMEMTAEGPLERSPFGRNRAMSLIESDSSELFSDEQAIKNFTYLPKDFHFELPADSAFFYNDGSERPATMRAIPVYPDQDSSSAAILQLYSLWQILVPNSATRNFENR